MSTRLWIASTILGSPWLSSVQVLVSSSFLALAAAATSFALSPRAFASVMTALYSPLANLSLRAPRAPSSDFIWSGTYFAASPLTALTASSATLKAASAGPLSLAQAVNITTVTNRADTKVNVFLFMSSPPVFQIVPQQMILANIPSMPESTHRFLVHSVPLRDSQFLPHPDNIGVVEDVAIRLKDFLEEIPVPVVMLCDFPKGLPLLDLMHLGRVPFVSPGRLLGFIVSHFVNLLSLFPVRRPWAYLTPSTLSTSMAAVPTPAVSHTGCKPTSP